MNPIRLLVALAMAACVTLAPLPGTAGDMYDFTPTGLLMRGASRSLPFAPEAVTAFDNTVFIIGGGDGKGKILRLDASTLDISATQDLDIVPSAMVANFAQTRLFVIGTLEDGRTQIEVRDTDLNQLGKITLKRPMQHPSLTMTKDEVLVVGSLSGGVASGLLTAFDMTHPSEPQPLPQLLPDLFGGAGVTRAWFDDTANKTLFVSTALPRSLIAVSTEGKAAGEKLSSLNFDDAAPVPIMANISSRPCLTDKPVAWFLIFSSGKLFLAEYDPASSFKSLDIVSLTDTDLNIASGFETQYYKDTKIQVSAHLLASSCDMSVIWIGDRNSREVEQFAVNPKADPPTLEKIGQFSLESVPDHLVMTVSGLHGYAVSARTNTIMRFDSGGGKVAGNETARILQRLLTEKGFPVGSIDGQIGERTLNAINRFQTTNNVTLDIHGNFNSVIGTLQATPAQ